MTTRPDDVGRTSSDHNLDRFLRHGLGHVHGDPRHPGRRHVLTDDPRGPRHSAGADELASNRLPHRRSDLDSAHRLADPRAHHARPVRDRDRGLHHRIGRVRAELGFRVADHMACRAGLCGRHSDPACLCRGLSAVSEPGRAGGDDHRRRARRARADGGSDRWRVDYPDLFLALAVPDQRRPWHYRLCGRLALPPARVPEPCACALPRPRLAGLHLAVPCRPRDRIEGSAAARMVVARVRLAVRPLPSVRHGLCEAQFARNSADRETRHPRATGASLSAAP